MMQASKFVDVENTYDQADILIQQNQIQEEQQKPKQDSKLLFAQTQQQQLNQTTANIKQPQEFDQYQYRGSFFISQEISGKQKNKKKSIAQLGKKIDHQLQVQKTKKFAKGENSQEIQLNKKKNNVTIGIGAIKTLASLAESSIPKSPMFKFNRKENVHSEGNKVFLRHLVGKILKSQTLFLEENKQDEKQKEGLDIEKVSEDDLYGNLDDIPIKESIEESKSSKVNEVQTFSSSSSRNSASDY